MTTIDFSPLFRSTVGFDRLATLLDSTMQQSNSNGYPPYDIESPEENQYTITLAVAGFAEEDLDLQTEKGVLTIKGRQSEAREGNYLHRGIARRAFERKFQLADHVEISGAELINGLLVISLRREVPEAMKPKRITIGSGAVGAGALEHEKASAQVSREVA